MLKQWLKERAIYFSRQRKRKHLAIWRYLGPHGNRVERIVYAFYNSVVLSLLSVLWLFSRCMPCELTAWPSIIFDDYFPTMIFVCRWKHRQQVQHRFTHWGTDSASSWSRIPLSLLAGHNSAGQGDPRTPAGFLQCLCFGWGSEWQRSQVLSAPL
jgi:hypothetical protein